MTTRLLVFVSFLSDFNQRDSEGPRWGWGGILQCAQGASPVRPCRRRRNSCRVWRTTFEGRSQVFTAFHWRRRRITFPEMWGTRPSSPGPRKATATPYPSVKQACNVSYGHVCLWECVGPRSSWSITVYFQYTSERCILAVANRRNEKGGGVDL